jgi:uncharacterized protein (TIGR02452 family)
MPPSKSSRSSKPKASKIAAEVKKHYIPYIKENFPHWPAYSHLYRKPTEELHIKAPSQLDPPSFQVLKGDPVDITIIMATQETDRLGEEVRIPFVCAANEKRPGGDWETGVAGYEERLCRRSNLTAALSKPYLPGVSSNYPIPCEGGILSSFVTVFRGPGDVYEPLHRDDWRNLPVISIVPTRGPKLSSSGTKYSFSQERDLAKTKIRAALRIAVYNKYRSIVIGDFGLGNGARNPPRELAELWREVFLFDPEIRGQFLWVAFVFDDTSQSTTKNILDDIEKKSKSNNSHHHYHGSSSNSSSSSHKGKGKAKESSSHSSSSHQSSPSDYEIFQDVFDADEIQRVLTQPDPRYGLSMIAS